MSFYGAAECPRIVSTYILNSLYTADVLWYIQYINIYIYIYLFLFLYFFHIIIVHPFVALSRQNKTLHFLDPKINLYTVLSSFIFNHRIRIRNNWNLSNPSVKQKILNDILLRFFRNKISRKLPFSLSASLSQYQSEL